MARREGTLDGSTEEPALERSEQLLADEGLHVDGAPVALEHADVVLEHVVRLSEGVVQLVPLEDVLVPPGLVGAAELRIDRAADGPYGTRLALDPDDDPLFVPERTGG